MNSAAIRARKSCDSLPDCIRGRGPGKLGRRGEEWWLRPLLSLVIMDCGKCGGILCQCLGVGGLELRNCNYKDLQMLLSFVGAFTVPFRAIP